MGVAGTSPLHGFSKAYWAAVRILVKNTQIGREVEYGSKAAFVLTDLSLYYTVHYWAACPAAMFVFLARTARARIVASYFSLCLAVCRSLCAESGCRHSALRRRVAVNRSHSSSNTEDQFFSDSTSILSL